MLGLSTALAIQQHLKPGQSLLIVAREFPNTTSINYASPWAGAHYRPAPGKSPQVVREARWARHTYDIFQKIAAEEPAAGVEFMEGIEHFENPPQEYLDAIRDPDSAYAHLGDSLRELSPAELPEGVKWGIRYWAYCINPPVYCAHLLRKFILRGGQTKEYTLASLLEAFHLASNVTTVVNCSGLGFADPKSFIIRGMQLTSQLLPRFCMNMLSSNDYDLQARLVSSAIPPARPSHGKTPTARGPSRSRGRSKEAPSSAAPSSRTTGTQNRCQRSGPRCSPTPPNGSPSRRKATASST